jgi:hypothetical protein
MVELEPLVLILPRMAMSLALQKRHQMVAKKVEPNIVAMPILNGQPKKL